MDAIRYEHYVADGNLHQCWFCGKPTKDYRAFEYSQFSTKVTSPYSYKEIERTTAVKIYCCKDCCKKFDEYSASSEGIFSEYLGVVAISGFLATILCAFIFGAKLGKAIIIAILMTVVLIGILFHRLRFFFDGDVSYDLLLGDFAYRYGISKFSHLTG